jgi:HEAT repeat protein
MEQRLQTAQLICLNYDREGFEEPQRALELLLARLTSGEEPVLVQRAMFSAACLLDDGTHATPLWEIAQADPTLKWTVERALVKWRSPVALDAWRRVLRVADSSPLELAVALDGLAVLGTPDDQSLLVAVLRSNATTPTNRVLAAHALGSLCRSGLNELAREVLNSTAENRNLVAAELIHRHTDSDTLAQLDAILAGDSDSAMVTAASALVNHFPMQARARAPEWIRHPDSQVRILALKVLSQQPDETSVALQSELLADSDPNLRSAAREHLMVQAAGDWRSTVDECITRQLGSDDWKGIEQAIILCAQLQDRSRCNTLVELLDHPRPNVGMHAGWALMELANQPETLERIQVHCELLTERLERGNTPLGKAEVLRLSYLLEALGRNRVESSLSMLKKYIPKDDFKMGNISRTSAIWAIGMLLEGKDVPEIRAQLRERIGDLPPDKPENYLVRYACILTLGRLASPDSQDIIVQYGGRPPNPMGYAAQWALQRIEQANR